MEPINVNQQHAAALRAAAIGDGAETDATLRDSVLERAAGGAPVAEPYDTLARQIGEAAYRVTDAHVAAVREAAGSDKAAFEVIMSACVGAGLVRWDAAARVIEEAIDAAS
ncbi:hypothetical protein ACOACO_14115 [Nocardioides sp. CPCC 205120]|uniref:hypothetical protein n=1 Tax=Nocardioides sp. CPCC 205120 TaxID=3406462 RepID=UPI003B50091E